MGRAAIYTIADMNQAELPRIQVKRERSMATETTLIFLINFNPPSNTALRRSVRGGEGEIDRIGKKDKEYGRLKPIEAKWITGWAFRVRRE